MGSGRRLKTMAGSGAWWVFDDKTDGVACCAASCRFYAHESCGQCTPCVKARVGCAGLHTSAEGESRPGDIDLLADVAKRDRGQFHLRPGRARCLAMLGFLTKFRADFEAAAAQGPGVMNLAAHSASLARHRVCHSERRASRGRAHDHHPAANPVSAVMSLVLSFAALAGLSSPPCRRTFSPCCRSWSTPAPSWCCSCSSS